MAVRFSGGVIGTLPMTPSQLKDVRNLYHARQYQKE